MPLQLNIFKWILLIIIPLCFLINCQHPVSTFNPLEKYANIPDDDFKYEIRETHRGKNWTEYRIHMISGVWLTEEEVDQPEWWHWVTIIIPDSLKEAEALLIIGGGSTNDRDPNQASEILIESALYTRSIIAEVSNIPFQPLDFKNDKKGDRYEDDLIAYGWRKFLEGGARDEDIEWLARLPMTRAVSRAMDVVQSISRNIENPVEKFVIAGASKRGWTTWTSAIADDRVIAIVPIVIDLLNVIPSFHHHWQCYGEWSPAINDYLNEGIMEWMGSKEYDRLLELVEPYSFIDELNLPKFLINASSDEFFITDSWKFYWNDLHGDKYLQYVPNANHGLNGTYNMGSMMAFYNAIIKDEKIPDFNWYVNGDSIYVQVDPHSAYKITKWEAINSETRDFRISSIGKAWQASELNLTKDGKYAIQITAPEAGYKAGMIEVIFNPDTDLPFTFTSGTIVNPDTYPFKPFAPPEPKGTFD